MSFAVFYHTLSVILGQVFHRPLRLFELEKAEMIPDYLQRKVLSGCKSHNSVSFSVVFLNRSAWKAVVYDREQGKKYDTEFISFTELSDEASGLGQKAP